MALAHLVRRPRAGGWLLLLSLVALAVPQAVPVADIVGQRSTGSTAAHAAPARAAAAGRAGLRHRVATHEDWHRVLSRLSNLRAVAWRQGEPRLLRRVYEQSAEPLHRDQAMLRQYVDRGLHVRGVRLAFGRVQVVHHDAGTVVLRVTDQLGRAMAVTTTGRRIQLPHDQPTRHTIVLRHHRRGWRITTVMRR